MPQDNIDTWMDIAIQVAQRVIQDFRKCLDVRDNQMLYFKNEEIVFCLNLIKDNISFDAEDLYNFLQDDRNHGNSYPRLNQTSKTIQSFWIIYRRLIEILIREFSPLNVPTSGNTIVTNDKLNGVAIRLTDELTRVFSQGSKK